MIKLVRDAYYKDGQHSTRIYYLLESNVFQTTVSSHKYLCIAFTYFKSELDDDYKKKPDYCFLGKVSNPGGNSYNTWVEIDGVKYTDKDIEKNIEKFNALLTQKTNEEILDSLE